MPAIDLARLKKQTARLSGSLRSAVGVFTSAARDPGVLCKPVLCEVKVSLPLPYCRPTARRSLCFARSRRNWVPLQPRQPLQALELADALWDEGWLETRLLAAFLLGRIPPQEERLLARLTAWTQAVRDPEVRAALLTTSLTRLRKETPDLFLVLVKEWLHPARQRMWSNGVQALVPLISSPDFDNLPPIFEIVEPIIKASPGTLQFDLQELITVLFEASPEETTYFLQQILKETKSPLPSIALRRMSPELPHEFNPACGKCFAKPRPARD